MSGLNEGKTKGRVVRVHECVASCLHLGHRSAVVHVEGSGATSRHDRASNIRSRAREVVHRGVHTRASVGEVGDSEQGLRLPALRRFTSIAKLAASVAKALDEKGSKDPKVVKAREKLLGEFMELKLAMEHIEQHPLLGNGFVSSQWNGGWHEILGYFYPVDIGILGNIFVFGCIGTALIYLPFYYSYDYSRKVESGDVFFKTCEYMLLFFFLSMFFSAVNIRDSSSIMFLVCLLYYYRYRQGGAVEPQMTWNNARA